MTKKERNPCCVMWGERFFKIRSYTPIPLLLIMFFCYWGEWENDTLVWLIGISLVVVGESLRFWALRYIGKYSRTRKRKGRILVTDGPYAFIRNPLYYGNLLILLGFTIASELMWFVPVVMLLFYLQYHSIVKWEEEILIEYFSQDAELYFQAVPRWLPKWRNMWDHLQIPSTSRYPWGNIIRREKSTLQFLVVMNIALLIKELLG